jgi:hypothetical protein
MDLGSWKRAIQQVGLVVGDVLHNFVKLIVVSVPIPRLARQQLMPTHSHDPMLLPGLMAIPCGFLEGRHFCQLISFPSPAIS